MDNPPYYTTEAASWVQGISGSESNFIMKNYSHYRLVGAAINMSYIGNA